MHNYSGCFEESGKIPGSFAISWEQRKLGDLVIGHNAGIYISKEDYGEGTNIIGVGNIYERDIFNGEIYRLGPVNDDKFILEENDIIYGESSLVPEGIARTVCVGKNGAGSAFAWHTRRVKLDKNIVNSHVATLELNYHHDIRKYLVSVSTQTALTGMTTEGYFGATLTLPSVEEQQKISSYFKNLDHLITLHQRKQCILYIMEKLLCGKSKQLEKSISWEQRKLYEMCGTFEYGLNAAAKEFDGKNKYIRITDIDDASREFLFSDLSSPDICLDGMSKYLLSRGDIVFARTGASVGKTYIYRENDDVVYFAGFLIRTKVNQDNDAEFVFQSTLSPSYEKYIRITSQRSGQPGVNAQEYGEYDLFIPSKKEQQRIGQFLRGIDNLIALHQRKP